MSLPCDTNILLVEDSPTDILMTREAMENSRTPNVLHVVVDGEEALSFLRRQGAYAQAPIPDLILLDLNLPRKNGAEVLAEIKADELLRVIPVVVLSTSQAAEDVAKAYDLHANCYVVKPFDFDDFARLMHTLQEFWFWVVNLPEERS